MKLLVSVRSPAEVGAALTGGADIIDAKEPARGALGSVSPGTLAEILEQLPPDVPLSVALGDVSTVEEVVAAVGALDVPFRPAPTFLKLGFAGVGSPQHIGSLLEVAVQLASAWTVVPRIVAVAYADNERAGSVSPTLICSPAVAAGAAGVLVDTYVKDGAGLFHWWDPGALASWVFKARSMGLLTALAGSLMPDDVATVATAGPDVAGFRAAACKSGRAGQVSVRRVRLLRERIDRSVMPVAGSAHAATPHRETRAMGLIPSPKHDSKSHNINN